MVSASPPTTPCSTWSASTAGCRRTPTGRAAAVAETVERSLRHSVNVGAYDDGGGCVGFLRIVTDRATFAWVCDVYVDPAASRRGRRQAADGRGRTGCSRRTASGGRMLATADAHGLYAQHGFAPLAESGPLDGAGLRASNPSRRGVVGPSGTRTPRSAPVVPTRWPTEVAGSVGGHGPTGATAG